MQEDFLFPSMLWLHGINCLNIVSVCEKNSYDQL